MAKSAYQSQKEICERKIQVYLHPRIYKLFVADANLKVRKYGTHAARMLEDHYNKLPPADIRMLEAKYVEIINSGLKLRRKK